MKKFWIKMCSLVLLLFLIGGYNTVLAMREQRDEIARLTAELEGSKMTDIELYPADTLIRCVESYA